MSAPDFLTFLWSSPNTLLGLLLGLLNGTRPRMGPLGQVEFVMDGGWVRSICSWLGISAFTLGDTVLYAVQPTYNLRVHESRHSAQYRALGPLFLPVYYLLLGYFRYADHPLEQDARQHELQVCGCVGASKLLDPSVSDN